MRNAGAMGKVLQIVIDEYAEYSAASLRPPKMVNSQWCDTSYT